MSSGLEGQENAECEMRNAEWEMWNELTGNTERGALSQWEVLSSKLAR